MRGWSWELSLSSRRSVWLGTARGGCLEKVGWESSRGKHTIRRGRREQARFSACFRKNVYDLRLEFFLFLPSSVLLLIKSPRETVESHVPTEILAEWKDEAALTESVWAREDASPTWRSRCPSSPRAFTSLLRAPGSQGRCSLPPRLKVTRARMWH